MRTTLLPIAIAAALVAASAGAEPAAEPVQKAVGQSTKMVCKKFQATGTRLGTRRVCATEEQWRQRSEDDQEAVNALQVDRTSLCAVTPCK